ADILLGNVTVEVDGEEHLLTAAEKTKDTEKDKGFIAATSHLTDVDVSTITSIIAKMNKIVVPVAETNMRLWHQRLPYELVGMDNVYPVAYENMPGASGESSGESKYPLRFNSSDYDGLTQRMTDSGLTVVTAAHNPVTGYGVENNGELPNKPGKLVPHLALSTGRAILPALMQVEGQRRNPTQLNDNKIHPSWSLTNKGVSLVFGEPVTPSNQDVENYKDVLDSLSGPSSEAARQKQREILNELGGVVLDWMHQNYDWELAS
ncbi:MAG: hypothetical protein D8G53_15615, partial [Candidatus Saccharimonas sp.]